MRSHFREGVHVIDSHTEGEPTRTVIAGGPDLGSGTLMDRVARFRDSYDTFRSAVVNEPRGSDFLVGALLTEPTDKSCATGVIYFNNVGVLGMCGHGTIGVVATLAHMGRIEAGIHRIETPVGIVTATLHESGKVSIENVPSYRFAKQVPVFIERHGIVRGDIAWGGNWFFLVSDHGLELTLANVKELTDFTTKIRNALRVQGIAGRNDQEIDHVELFGPTEGYGCRNFVLCPGDAYDRSPCGTGTSAKLACLFADGKIAEGDVWRQDGILGTYFEGKVRIDGDKIIPTITGSAYITGEADLIYMPGDPFRDGIR